MFRAVYVDPGGPEKQVEMLIQPMGHRIEAAGAGHLEVALVGRAQANVVNLIVGAAMLGEEVGTAAYRHAVQVPDTGAVIDGTGRNGLAEFKRLPFQIEHGNQYGHGILTVTRWWQERLDARRQSPVVTSGSKAIIYADVWLQGGSQRVGIDRDLVEIRRFVL